MDRAAWRATVHGVAKSWTRLSDSHTHVRVHAGTATTPREETTGLNRSFSVLICFPCTGQAQLTAPRLLAFPRGGSKPSSCSLPALKSSGGLGLLQEDAGNG